MKFYAWNRCLGVCGVRSWGPTAKATHGSAARGPNRGPYFWARLPFVIKGLVWGLGQNGWLDPTQGSQPSPTTYDTPHFAMVGSKTRKIGKAIAHAKSWVGGASGIWTFMPGIGA